jgi:hypothetical protein
MVADQIAPLTGAVVDREREHRACCGFDHERLIELARRWGW